MTKEGNSSKMTWIICAILLDLIKLKFWIGSGMKDKTISGNFTLYQCTLKHVCAYNLILVKIMILFYSRCFIFDCPSGSLRKEKVLEMYTMILPEKNAQVFVNHIFRVFDRDNNGCIDFKVGLI